MNIHCPSCVSTIQSIFSEVFLREKTRFPIHRKSVNEVLGSGLFALQSTSPTSPESFPLEGSDLASIQLDVSLLDGTVSFIRPSRFSVKKVVVELENAGFEVVQTVALEDVEGTAGSYTNKHVMPTSTWSRLTGFKKSKGRKEAHKDNCQACSAEKAAENERVRVSPEPHRIQSADLVSGKAVETQQRLAVQAIFAVEGMTCS